MRLLLKEGDARFMVKYAVRVHQQVADLSRLAGFFGPADILVPVPGSRPKPEGDGGVAARLADALVREGVGNIAWRGLRRTCAVRKSATSLRGSRPTVGHHYKSFATEPTEMRPASIVLIDDVVTKGRTLLAAATRLHEAFPCAEIRAFALVRTMGLVSGVQQLLDPCQGEIRWKDGDACRIP
jgi:predicted amidophosphoribosyltransferase